MMEIRPSGHALHLVSALTNAQNHDLHVQAIRARDEALSSSTESYNNLCLQLALILVGADQPQLMQMNPTELEGWRQSDPVTFAELERDARRWIPFGQMAGLILKSALLYQSLCLKPPISDQIKQILLQALHCTNSELRAVASSIIATTSVSVDGVQPYLHIRNWPELIPALLSNLHDIQSATSVAVVEGSLDTIRKMLEDGPTQIDTESYDRLVPALLPFLTSNHEKYKILALQCLATVVALEIMPGTLVLHFDQYLASLSNLSSSSTDPSPSVRQWVCRTIVIILQRRTEYLRPHLNSIAQFMLSSTADRQHPSVALEACEFWLCFATLEEDCYSSDMYDTIGNILPLLIPVLLENMVYSQEQRIELMAQNQADLEEAREEMAPVFHKSRAKQAGQPSKTANDDDDSEDSGEGYEVDSEDDEYDDTDGNEWTLRKCSAASLDSLANMYGAEPILPSLLPALEQGLSSSDQWIQEASILALGAIAEGCEQHINQHMSQLHPYLMNILAAPMSSSILPQLQSIASWTVGRYTQWAIEQVQTGAQGDLLARMTEVFLSLMNHQNRRVQVACCSAFGVIIEAAGDLMTPYLEPVYTSLVSAMTRYSGKSLLLVFDVIGTMADNCGSSIAEGNLPSIYMPAILSMWSNIARNSASDRILLPLMESLASIAMVTGPSIEQYALECFENAMSTIEVVQLELHTLETTAENEEEADPIICATDLLDGLVEGLEQSFPVLVSKSKRYGQHFLSVVHSLCKHDIPGVRMSALALVGDLAHSCPTILKESITSFVQELSENVDAVQPTVCTNAVWALGEIFVKCQGKPHVIEPFAGTIIQRLISLLEGNGLSGAGGRGVDIPGLPENAAACAGRLAKVDPKFVAADLPRFLMGWCDAMAHIVDPVERHDAFEGFIQAVYANPQAIEQASPNISSSIANVLFAIVSWHIPPSLHDSEGLLSGEYKFLPFPPHEAALGQALHKLVHDIKASVGEETWLLSMKNLPVNIRRLLREGYQLQ